MKHKLYAFILTISLVFIVTGCKTVEKSDETEADYISVSMSENENSPISSTVESVTLNNTSTPCDSLAIDAIVNTLSETISQSHENPIENISNFVEGTYNYKGIELKGEYYKKDAFYVDLNFLRESIGISLHITSCKAALALLNNDLDTLIQCFDNEVYKQNQIENMQHRGKEKTIRDNLICLTINDIRINPKGNDKPFQVDYIAYFNDDSSICISMDIYLNESNEWRIMAIEFTG